MKLFLLFIFQIFLLKLVLSQQVGKQKFSIDSSVLNKWPTISKGMISNNGSYVSYVVNQFLPKEEIICFLQSTDNKWQLSFKGVNDVKFSRNSKKAFLINKDSLCIQALGNTKRQVIPNVKSFKVISNKNSEWLLYQLQGQDRKLVVRNLDSDIEQRFDKVDDYFVSNNGQVIALSSRLTETNENVLFLIDLLYESSKRIVWQSKESKVSQMIMDETGAHIAFSIINTIGQHSIWCYNKNYAKAVMLITDSAKNFDKQLCIGRLDFYSKDGKRLFFMLEQKDTLFKSNQNYANVNIWSYRDLKPQAEQLSELKNNKIINTKYFSVIIVDDHRVVQIGKEGEEIVYAKSNDEYCLLRQLEPNRNASVAEQSWNLGYQNSNLYLVSLRNGERKLLPWKHKMNIQSAFSPNGKYIIYWEKPDQYYCYEISTGVNTKITEQINADITTESLFDNEAEVSKSLIGVAGWLKDDKMVLIYDRNDIWMVDPKGHDKPINITNGYGLRNHIILRFALKNYKEKGIKLGEELILVAFNQYTKENGYYSKVLGMQGDPKKLIMSNYLYSDIPAFSNIFNGGLLKPEQANSYLIMRQSAAEYPNYYVTDDFKSFHKISNVQPERPWNWLTSELHSWRTLDGDTLQGILYKPQNFDPAKKYPVVFNYYEKKSDELNEYKMPEWTTDNINIPWFISRGYLVFCIDIHYHMPSLKESVINSAVSAAKYISQYKYVDSLHMGIQGHSFGGLETGILITGTNIFAAACAASGYYDLISDYGTLTPQRGVPRSGAPTYNRMGGTPWNNPEIYIKSSPIYFLQDVNVPVLMMTGEKDDNVPTIQSIEMFLGLRRLNKPVWMLSYENAGHVLFRNIEDAKDFTVRMTQFFDHYLKELPPPLWMTTSIHATMKGIETGYVLDPYGYCNKGCKICQKWNEQYRRTPNMFLKPENEWKLDEDLASLQSVQ